MKNSPLLSIAVLISAFVAFTSSVPGASSPVLHQPTPTERIALDLVNAGIPDAALSAALLKEGISSGRKHDEIVTLVKNMRQVVADGVVPGSTAFWRFLEATAPQQGEAAQRKISAPRATATRTSKSTNSENSATAPEGAKAQTPAAADETPEQKAERLGREYRNKLLVDAMAATEPIDDSSMFFHSGLRMMAPYTVDGASVVKSDSTRVGGFLEFVHTYIWAWRPDRLATTQRRTLNALGYLPANEAWEDVTLWAKKQGTANREPNPEIRFDHWGLLDFANGIDATCRLSFEFGANGAVDASTIAGSGDFTAEVSLDKHVFRGWTRTTAFSVNLGGSIGAVTDRSAIRVHPRYIVGPSAVMAFDDPLRQGQTTQRRGLFTVRAGRAVIDSVTFLDRSSMVLRTVSPGVPRYVKRYTNAIEAELFYPLGMQSLVTAGARVYNGSTDLAPWSLYLGITTPLTEIAKGLFPK